MTNVPRMLTQTSPLPGMSVRESAQAIGTPKTTHRLAAETPSTREFTSAST